MDDDDDVSYTALFENRAPPLNHSKSIDQSTISPLKYVYIYIYMCVYTV